MHRIESSYGRRFCSHYLHRFQLLFYKLFFRNSSSDWVGLMESWETNVTSVPSQRHLPEKPTLLCVQIVEESLVLLMLLGGR